MERIKLNTRFRHLLADTVTPVSVYLRLRDVYAESILLESSDYRGTDNSFSYVCCDPVAEFRVRNGIATVRQPNRPLQEFNVSNKGEAIAKLKEFAAGFEVEEQEDQKFISNGLFGYMAYDAVTLYEDLDFSENEPSGYDAPEMIYRVYRYVIAINHFNNDLYVFEHEPEGMYDGAGLDNIIAIMKAQALPTYLFNSEHDEESNFTDEEYVEVVKKGIGHCMRGDVFQIVLSRRFSTGFQGDEFNVYRALRSINPSPYLFFFDFGSFKIFGSSPEAQLVIKDQQASIFPIAGTFRRTGDDKSDAELATKLFADPKENSEHVMLVDLARNDLSRHGDEVKVEVFKEIQFYSHVIHLVSKVTGKLEDQGEGYQMAADTFPAGTLSGAPKHMAMKLINEYEPNRRGYYGGAIGFMGFNGDFNHAIMIRSFMSKANRLYYQAGAGVVAKSVPESELQEVNNKLAALRKAIKTAEQVGR
ncbi:anthranilate synthase component I family protein [Persicobacter sp. CCB-QB2]|uniref:anthranilate synthase component I family protein n=1 Tax=Persicobacter sp. CCB-QB2 TaxID=1561025 RepID=UPI0006A94514|nr:anthranilate synthase component I family protein [Persicobacter sp. CCB-QB2]